MSVPILSLITFLPIIGVFFIISIDSKNRELIRFTALLVSIIVFLISLPLYFNFDARTYEMQFVEKLRWIPSFGIKYHVGVDGISLFLILLTTFLTPISILASWHITKNVKEYMISMLILETAMVGVFISLDLFLFFVFWELMLIPMYLLIGIWGGSRRIYAAVKFFIYTTAGSVFMFLAIIALYFLNYRATGEYTFNLLELYKLDISFAVQFWLFIAFAFAFAIKVPMFPFHTWLPDAHVEAPTAGSVILAGVLLKMGTYGFMRFCLPLFPEVSHAFIPVISWMAIVGIIYGALVSMVQDDLKKLVAYSSVSHLGFVMLGIFAFNIQGIEGGITQMINHGLSTGALFLVVGMLYERRHTRMIADFGGLTKQIPIFAIFFLVVTLSSIGLPGLNGFVGEFLILMGTFKSRILYASIAASGIILAAVYMLWMFQRVMFNEITHEENKTLKDMNKREFAILLPIIFLIFWIGIYPNSFLRKMDASVNHLLKQVGEKANVVSNTQRQKRVEQLQQNVMPKIDIISETKTEW
ncbi:MAG: NADH-ubiquinone oxidoreductase chain M [Candidatus Jettenia ecosi]|uniref:NADH-ubiquinone oxidoreductase chain M n=1 Tax=Candidatus Jettenia ecosi TaxID=2494326 RepID=A0A533QDG3_9BACT|nr:MAG: NADH-ubiquinone oxidoreductase chain M [Candidatus Jettenia ecosi]